MLNTREFYFGLGKKVAEARNQFDESRAQFHKQHFTKARALEDADGRAEAAFAFDDGYAAHRNVPRPEYFR